MPSVLHLQDLTRAENGTQNTASCMKQQGVGSRAENQQERLTVRVEMGRPCGKNGRTRMGTGYISVGRKIR